ncbi:hypothetical protein CPC08DRAFT_705949 [Agrocybe pediades]|nr:hypothetical protein CPC08DRAFT_705949 [Agrocybe pediades]
MAPSNALEILRKGLNKFKQSIDDRKSALTQKLQRGESISSEDEHWLMSRNVFRHSVQKRKSLLRSCVNGQEIFK